MDQPRSLWFQWWAQDVSVHALTWADIKTEGNYRTVLGIVKIIVCNFKWQFLKIVSSPSPLPQMCQHFLSYYSGHVNMKQSYKDTSHINDEKVSTRWHVDGLQTHHEHLQDTSIERVPLHQVMFLPSKHNTSKIYS